MNIEVQVGDLTQWHGDGIVVGVFNDEPRIAGIAAEVDRALGGVISAALANGEFSGRYTLHYAFYTMDKLPAARVAVVGLGKHAKWKLDRVRRAVADGVKDLRQLGAKKVATTILGPAGAASTHPPDEAAGSGSGRAEAVANDALTGKPVDLAQAAQAMAEGIVMGLFRFQKYYTPAADELWEDDFRLQLDSVTILVPEAAQLETVRAAAERGRIIGESTNLARTLANEPGNSLTPMQLAETARAMCAENGLEFYVIDRAEAEKKGMGAFLGVAQGSAQPPAMIVMRYWGAGKQQEGGLGLIGKGITFDSGGISLKAGENMQHMKGDMSGGAATIAAMQGIARLKPPINVTGVVAATENMPGGKAFKPGDILRAMNGKTIEIVNTDAEGRLVLADAVAYATRELKLNPVLDAATLTGSIIIALGIYRTGVFSNDNALAQKLVELGDRTGERMWQLPMDDEYLMQLKSDWADLKNSGGRVAGSITGAWFIHRFVENNAKWAHLDIAGSVHLGEGKERGYVNKWGNGTPTRTFIEFALELGNGEW